MKGKKGKKEDRQKVVRDLKKRGREGVRRGSKEERRKERCSKEGKRKKLRKGKRISEGSRKEGMIKGKKE